MKLITATRKLSYRKDDRAMHSICGCPENFRESLSTSSATYPEIFNGFLKNVRTKFEVCSFTRSWDNRGTLKFWAFLGAHAPFTQKCLGLLFWWTLRMYRSNLKSVALLVPEIIAVEILGGGCKPQSWGIAGRRGSGWYHSIEHWPVPTRHL